MSDVIEVRFGKEEREYARKFARLLGLVEQHDADVLADPIKHIKLASEEIARTRRQIQDARDAYRSSCAVSCVQDDEPISSLNILDTLHVPRRDWEALQQMRKIVFSDDYQ